MSYQYLLSVDFLQSHEINDTIFICDLQAHPEITAQLTSIQVEDDNVFLQFDRELTDEEKSSLLEIIHNHNPNNTDFDRFALLSDEKPAGTNGGDVEGQRWLIRDLNKITGSNINSWITLNSNTIILIPGYYFISGILPTLNVGKNQSRLYDITNDRALVYGNNSTSKTNQIIGHFRINSSTCSLRLETFCQRSRLKTGFGVAINNGGPEIYSCITIKKIS